MRAIIVDDEYETLLELRELLGDFAGVQLVGSYSTPLLVLPELEQTQPDCAFVDIEMPGMSGLDLTEQLVTHRPGLHVVFVTAFNNYATQAFELNALDYVLKPIDPERLRKTMARLAAQSVPGLTPSSAQSVIRSLGGFEVLVGSQPLRWNRSKARELLAYLVLHSGTKRNKYKICEDLWPQSDPHKALMNLQTAVYSLRKSLWDAGDRSILIDYSAESYELKLNQAQWDASQFRDLCSQYRQSGDSSLAWAALQLYRGEFGDGEDWPWAMLTAHELFAQYSGLLRQLAQNEYSKGNWSQAAEAAERLLRHQPAEGSLQRLLLDAAWHDQGLAGLTQRVNILRQICQTEYDAGLEPEALAYCQGKGITP